MSRIYNRSIRREIRQSFGRFAAIIAIVALGVGFLVGILSSTPDMKTTVQQYYQDYAMSDFNLKSTLGFTGDDIDAIADIPEIDTVMPANVVDSLVYINNEDLVTGRLYGTDLDNQTVNKLQLLDGRMPENSSECVIEKPDGHLNDVAIGDVITISEENDDYDTLYEQTEFTVVGTVNSPYYFCNSREPSTVGTGRTGVIMYTYSDAYKTDIYTDLFLITACEYGTFTEEYDEYIDDVTIKLEEVTDERLEIRYDEIITEANDQLQDAKDTLSEERAKVDAELEDAEAELEDGQAEYDEGLARLQDAQEQIDSGYAQLDASKEQIADGRAEIEAARAELNDAKAQLDASRDSVDQAKAALAAGITLPDEVMQQIAAYDEGLAQWESGTALLAEQEAALDEAEALIAETEADLAEASEELDANMAKLDDAAVELEDGYQQLEDGRAEAESQFADAEVEIADAENEINEIEPGECYILDRDSNVSFARYSIDIEKVADIATLFPVFFFLIAALVSLTTMTRMVEEERIQIGTLKALGYRRITIMSKYLIYCGVATVIGCIIGLMMGYRFLPLLIAMCFNTLYDLPPLITPFHPVYSVLSCGLELIGTLGATWAACHNSLKEKTSQLMTPRAPKAGKRIFMERLPVLWNRLSFSYKATVRNIFRYKKHLFMTVIGVAGCTALMVAGFGIQDSLTKLSTAQYGEIQKYDMQIELSGEESDDIIGSFIDDYENISIMSASMDITADSNDEQVNSALLYVPEAPEELKNFIGMRDRKTEEEVIFGSGSVVVCEKMAEVLEVSPGDTITLTDPDGNSGQITLTGVTENYSGCFIYVAPDVYSETFGEPDYNAYLLITEITGDSEQEDVTALLQESENVASVSFTDQSREAFDTLMDSLSLLVVVLVVFSGMLAAVVLYNLTNININERIRELATLRVLGYHHKEVAAYIFREISILTVIGTVTGLILGRILHYYIVLVAESTDMMLGHQTDVSTFILSAVFTLAFSVLVDVLMMFKLKRIDMAASMKAID